LPDFFALDAPVAMQIIQTVLASYRNRHLSFHNDAAGNVFGNQADYVHHGWHVHRFLHVRHSTFNDRICHFGTAPDAKQPYLQQMDKISLSPFKAFESPKIAPTYQRQQDVGM